MKSESVRKRHSANTPILSPRIHLNTFRIVCGTPGIYSSTHGTLLDTLENLYFLSRDIQGILVADHGISMAGPNFKPKFSVGLKFRQTLFLKNEKKLYPLNCFEILQNRFLSRRVHLAFHPHVKSSLKPKFSARLKSPTTLFLREKKKKYVS